MKLLQAIIEAEKHVGFSFVNVISPCVTFNRVDTFATFKGKVSLTEEDLSRPVEANLSMQSPDAEAGDMDLVAPGPNAPISASLSAEDPIARAVAEAGRGGRGAADGLSALCQTSAAI